MWLRGVVWSIHRCCISSFAFFGFIAIPVAATQPCGITRVAYMVQHHAVYSIYTRVSIYVLYRYTCSMLRVHE